jgi:hypothetical protein
VFTWIAQGDPATDFSGDLSQLLKRLSAVDNGPKSTDYMGYTAFGSETFYANGNVTFSAEQLTVDINGN